MDNASRPNLCGRCIPHRGQAAVLFMCFVCLCVNQEKFYKIVNKQKIKKNQELDFCVKDAMQGHVNIT